MELTFARPSIPVSVEQDRSIRRSLSQTDKFISPKITIRNRALTVRLNVAWAMQEYREALRAKIKSQL